jgi:mRNA interferase HigB
MELRGELLIDEFIEQYPHSKSPLTDWAKKVKDAHWKNFPELRETYPSADYVRPYVIFNIGGNKFRMVATVLFSKERVRVERIMTHKQYDRWKP